MHTKKKKKMDEYEWPTNPVKQGTEKFIYMKKYQNEDDLRVMIKCQATLHLSSNAIFGVNSENVSLPPCPSLTPSLFSLSLSLSLSPSPPPPPFFYFFNNNNTTNNNKYRFHFLLLFFSGAPGPTFIAMASV